MRVLEHLLKAVRDAAVFNPEVQVAPACILWPDHDRQWEAVIPRLQAELPELFILGDYTPDKRSGPAIWLRCVIAGKTDDESFPMKHTPIFYLPGVSRQDLRAVESCPDYLKPLAELQYRGVIWSQINAKDWTILAYLKSDQDGLGLDVALDNDAKNAMQLALYRLLDEEMELLKGKRLDKDYFNILLTGGDPVRDLLQWIDQSDAFQVNRGENEWKAFVEVCKSLLAFNPQKEGALAAAAKLAAHEGSWSAVWERFCEAPKRYPSIPARIRQCKMASLDLFSNQDTHGGWPQWNEQQEKCLHADLQAISNLPAHEARNNLLEMEKRHGCRRTLVWAELGEAPLAQALEHLAVLAETTKSGLAAGTAADLAAEYSSNGWKADDAVIRALSLVEKSADLEAISTAICSVYKPWAEESARHLQKVVAGGSYPGGANVTVKPPHPTHNLPSPQPPPDGRGSDRLYPPGCDCILFVDGLRYDAAKRLVDMLEKIGCTITENQRWAALPSVTGTGKPAVAPLNSACSVSEEPDPSEFQVLSPYQFDKAIKESGWLIIRPKDPVPPPIIAKSSVYSGPAVSVEFTDVVWKGLRCTVAVDGGITGLSLDVRMQPGNSLTSVVVGVKPLKGNGTASVVIENEDLEGHEATLVLIDANNGLVAQVATVIGGGGK